jgi:hypothetical protein
LRAAWTITGDANRNWHQPNQFVQDGPINSEATMQKKYDETNRGVLFKDEKKTTAEDRDYSGEIDVRGEKFWLSAWIKQSKAGKKYMSLSIKPKAKAKADFNDSVEF